MKFPAILPLLFPALLFAAANTPNSGLKYYYPTPDAPVAVYYEQRIAGVEKNGARITALRMENGGDFRGRMFIDASYEGDLMARAGVDYFVGREDFSAYGESKTGHKSPVPVPGVNAYVVEGDSSSGLIYNVFVDTPGGSRSGDGHVQAYNFRMYTQQNAPPFLRLEIPPSP